MAYSEFTLREALHRFQLSLQDVPDLFAGIPEVAPGPLLRSLVPVFMPLAMAINTEKARSELLIAPILASLRDQLENRMSLFSGTDFTVDPALGLAGYCDFILSRSPEQHFLVSPVVAIVEAKNENLTLGLGQCVAAMVAARLFNEREGRPIPTIHGAVTSGTLWRFLRLHEAMVSLDVIEYPLRQLPKLLGILTYIVTG